MIYFSGSENDAVDLQFISKIKGDDVGSFGDGKAGFHTPSDVSYPWVNFPFAIEVVDVKIC